MGRAPCCEKVGLNRGPWTKNEDEVLINYINENGHGNWRALPKKAGLLRCGKSCRLRWANYLRPDIKRGNFTKEEEDVIIQLNQELGNKWSVIASKLPGRTDNEIKNVWNTHLRKRLNNPPEETKRQRTRKRSRKDYKSKKDDTNEQPVKNLSAIKDNNNSNGDNDRQECIKMKETNSPSQSLLKTSTSVNSFASTVTSSSCTSCIDDDTLGNSSEVDNFWADVLSGNLSIMETSDHLPQVHGYGPLLSTSSAVDGFEYFDQNKTQDNEMDFWCNYLTIDGELQELMSNM